MIYHNQYRPKHKGKKAQLDTVRAESRTSAINGNAFHNAKERPADEQCDAMHDNPENVRRRDCLPRHLTFNHL